MIQLIALQALGDQRKYILETRFRTARVTEEKLFGMSDLDVWSVGGRGGGVYMEYTGGDVADAYLPQNRCFPTHDNSLLVFATIIWLIIVFDW